jgi:hypothetical protein
MRDAVTAALQRSRRMDDICWRVADSFMIPWPEDTTEHP